MGATSWVPCYCASGPVLPPDMLVLPWVLPTVDRISLKVPNRSQAPSQGWLHPWAVGSDHWKSSQVTDFCSRPFEEGRDIQRTRQKNVLPFSAFFKSAKISIKTSIRGPVCRLKTGNLFRMAGADLFVFLPEVTATHLHPQHPPIKTAQLQNLTFSNCHVTKLFQIYTSWITQLHLKFS